ncbi:MAG TPA: SGNH/GDSL hydrolase family protein [Rariglobus sp.]|nr:SGNH/GDSL hydrolase family protein [Rariglobus sp.]
MRQFLCALCFSIILMPLAQGQAAAGNSNAKEPDPRLRPGVFGWGLRKAPITDPSLPKVLLIGDSILDGYRATVAEGLKGKATVDAWIQPYHQNSPELPAELKRVLAQDHYKVIHFNMGLHGWLKGRIPEEQFDPLTRKLVRMIRDQAPGAVLIWASTTPTWEPKNPKELNQAINPVILEHNAMAAKIMREEKIPIDDLYGLLVNQPQSALKDGIHWKQEGYTTLGAAVADITLKHLEAK